MRYFRARGVVEVALAVALGRVMRFFKVGLVFDFFSLLSYVFTCRVTHAVSSFASAGLYEMALSDVRIMRFLRL